MTHEVRTHGKDDMNQTQVRIQGKDDMNQTRGKNTTSSVRACPYYSYYSYYYRPQRTCRSRSRHMLRSATVVVAQR